MIPFDFFVGTAFASSLILALLYGFRSPWNRSSIGRAFLSLIVSLAVVLGMIATARFVGEYPYRDVVRIIVYSTLTVALVWITILVRREQRRGANR